MVLLSFSIKSVGAAALAVKDVAGDANHCRVIQGKEPPHFVNLFKGKMVIRNGKLPFSPLSLTFSSFLSYSLLFFLPFLYFSFFSLTL